MKSSQLRIFVSSTFKDLEDVRLQVLKFLGVLRSELIAMEVFGSDESTSKDVCLERVEACNFFIGIYAERYGFIDSETGLSLTELEYHAAYDKLQKRELRGLLLYVLHQEALWPINLVDRDPEAITKLKTFKSLVGSRHTWTAFKESSELPFLILRDTIRRLEIGTNTLLQPRQQLPVIQATKLDRPLGMGFFGQEMAGLFFGRNKEIDQLTAQIIQFQFSLLIGVSGMGKTSLLNAGILPYFHKISWACCITRPLNNPLQNLRATIWSQLVNGPLPAEFGLEDVIKGVLDANSKKKVLIIIDQFDDILNSTDENAVDELVRSLNQLYLLKHPNLHLLISYRGDVEPEIGMVWQKIAGAADGLPRYYLRPLSQNHAQDILNHTLNNLGIKFEAEIEFSHVIISDVVLESQNNGHNGIFPPFIQMVVSAIYHNSESKVFKQSTYQELGSAKAMISNYLYNQLNHLGVHKQNGIKFLTALVSNYGTKTQKNLQEIIRESDIEIVLSQTILNLLLDLRLVRSLDSGYEITHDLLARTILDGLMTDEEKEIRRFKYLLESKAQAFGSTRSLLSLAEYFYIYKHRHRIACNDDDFNLILKSAIQLNLPYGYWLDSDRFALIPDLELYHLGAYYSATHILQGTKPIKNYSDEDSFVSWEIFIPDFRKMALATSKEGTQIFFETGINHLDSSSNYKLTDKAKYKSALAAIHMAKYGTENDAKALFDWLNKDNLDRRQRYIALRALLHLCKRFKIFIPKKLLLDYSGMFWRSVLTDLDLEQFEAIDVSEIFELIESNLNYPGYGDFLVGLLLRVMQPADYESILKFITERFEDEKSDEFIFDKYLALALTAGADLDYFVHLITRAVKPLNIKFNSQLHQQIAELATTDFLSMLELFINRLLLGETNDEVNPWREVIHQENRYFYVWVMSCAYCKLAERDSLETLMTLLSHSFFTVRKAAFDRIAIIGKAEDMHLFCDIDIYKKNQEELKSAFCLMDFKAYLFDKYPKFCVNNNCKPIGNPLGALDLMPKSVGELVNPEVVRATNEMNYVGVSDADDLPF